MKKLVIIVVAVAVGLGGCVKKSADAENDASAHGRYSGIGTYVAGRLWQKMVVADNKDQTAAKLLDDDQIIVVVDSHTGEIRQCGNLSGYCIGMNPWTSHAAQNAPVKLTIHDDQLANEPIKVQMHTSVSVRHEKPAPKPAASGEDAAPPASSSDPAPGQG
jgi:hypothetical protein